MKKIAKLFMSIALFISCSGALLTVAVPQTAFAAKDCNSGFLGFPAWYRGLTDDNCAIKSPDSDGISNFIWHIVLNVLDIALTAVGYIATFFILFGGFQFLTSTGKAEAMAKARMTILNAVIGLVISIASVSIINALMGVL